MRSLQRELDESLRRIEEDVGGKSLISAVTLERDTGIEPASQAWEARVLPLY